MRIVYALVIAFLTSVSAFAQYSTRSFAFDSVNRQYVLYVPPSYDSTQPMPFILALHGLGDNMNNFKGINFNKVADTAHFIFAIPQALVDNVITGSTAWNSGAGIGSITLNPGVDDVGFLNALIDTVSAHYNIDSTRIYATGFSMGGFMCNRLALELSNRIAAIASVSGTIGNGIASDTAVRAIPVAHFHGTADQTVPYTNNYFGNDAEALVNYWVGVDHCDTVPEYIDTFPNTANDGKVVVHYKYANGDSNTEVEFFKVIGGAHEWLAQPANDVTYTVQIWNFFRRFHLTTQTVDTTDSTGTTGIYLVQNDEIHIYPNPTQGVLHIDLSQNYQGDVAVSIIDLTGRTIYRNNVASRSLTINTTAWSKGLYLVQLNNNGKLANYKAIVE